MTQTQNHKKLAYRLIGSDPMQRPHLVVPATIKAAVSAAASQHFANKRSRGRRRGTAPGPRGRGHGRIIDGGFGDAAPGCHGHGMVGVTWG
ncbi:MULTISPECIES: hypothetical protein [unclassified Bradyrhizobium]|uniref:hypothetical protein n=1 Tax=unclassified Bradyrhizobium TaxID=2631580 RepID=UPI0028E54E29|nr:MULTISPECIES: hypothetical protein [unclassified Bradyrhizobium]